MVVSNAMANGSSIWEGGWCSPTRHDWIVRGVRSTLEARAASSIPLIFIRRFNPFKEPRQTWGLVRRFAVLGAVEVVA